MPPGASRSNVAPPVIIQVVGASGSGKSLVIERAVRRLAARGLAVGVVKHSHHSPDLSGKDSARFAKAGASVVLFASDRSFVTFRGRTEDLVPALPVDVVLVEGYSRRTFGGLRLRMQGPEDASAALVRILRAAPLRPGPTRLKVDGRSRPVRGPWRFVAYLLRANDVRHVERED